MDVSSILLYSNALGYPYMDVFEVPSGYQRPYVEFSLSSFDLTSSFIVKKISGLEPPEISAWSNARSNNTNFGALTPREVSILLKLNPNNSEGKTVSQLRDELYKLINAPGGNEIQFFLVPSEDLPHKILTGAVSRIEANAFAQEQEALITMVFPNPLIKDYQQENLLSIAEIDPTDPSKYTITDPGSTAPHGINLTLVWTNPTPGYFRMETHHPNFISSNFEIEWFLAEDNVLVLNSEYGSLEATIYESWGGDSLNVGSAIKAGSTWPTIYPGSTVLYFPNISNWIPIDFSHHRTYWGI